MAQVDQVGLGLVTDNEIQSELRTGIKSWFSLQTVVGMLKKSINA